MDPTHKPDSVPLARSVIYLCDLPENVSKIGSSTETGRLAVFCSILLRMGLAMRWPLLVNPVVSYTAFSPLLRCERQASDRGGMFSVALSIPFPYGRASPGDRGHPALRSPDFPPRPAL